MPIGAACLGFKMFSGLNHSTVLLMPSWNEVSACQPRSFSGGGDVEPDFGDVAGSWWSVLRRFGVNYQFGEDVVYLVYGDAVSATDVVRAWEVGVG